MSEKGISRIRRVLLAVDAEVQGPDLYESATRLAACLDAELHAIFVEDINLLRLARLPFAREVRLMSATTRRLQHPDVERSMRAQAMREQEKLAATATRLNVRWSFSVTQGQVTAELAGAASETDVVVITPAGSVMARTLRTRTTLEAFGGSVPGSLLVLPSGARVLPPYLAIYDGTPLSDRALGMAAQLAGMNNGEISVLIVAADESSGTHLQDEAEAFLKKAELDARTRLLTRPDPVVLISAVRAAKPGTLVVAAGTPALSAETVRQVSEKTACATLLVR